MYPNGTYTGTAHGPTALQYLSWVGASTIRRANMGVGDLCCWATHIGIAVASNQMISAYDTAQGTLITAIDGAGPTGEGSAIIRRLNGAIPGNAADTASNSAIGCAPTAGLVVMAYALQNRIQWRRYLPGNQCHFR